MQEVWLDGGRLNGWWLYLCRQKSHRYSSQPARLLVKHGGQGREQEKVSVYIYIYHKILSKNWEDNRSIPKKNQSQWSSAPRASAHEVKILEAHAVFRGKNWPISTDFNYSVNSISHSHWVGHLGVISCYYKLQHRLVPRRRCWHPASDVDSIQLSTGLNNLHCGFGVWLVYDGIWFFWQISKSENTM